MIPRTPRITATCRICRINVYVPIPKQCLIPLQAYCNSPHAAKGFCELRKTKLVSRCKPKERRAWCSECLRSLWVSGSSSKFLETLCGVWKSKGIGCWTSRTRIHGTIQIPPHTLSHCHIHSEEKQWQIRGIARCWLHTLDLVGTRFVLSKRV